MTVPSFDVLGVRVHELDMNRAVDEIAGAIRQGARGYIAATGVHGIIESRRHPGLKNILNGAFLDVPDGMPLVWFGRLSGHGGVGRVYGPDLMLEMCRISVKEHWTHFLCGGEPGVAEDLKIQLENKFPGIRITGTYCPPFRALNTAEENELISSVAAVKPDLFWVGISTPKQEKMMAEYLPKLDVKIMLGVGAAFDIHSGRRKDAPGWIKKSGLQWLHRLCQEPRRLGPRYFYIVPVFLFLAVLQLMRRKKQKKGPESSEAR